MKERPILFSGAMVRAILEGRKTQTRRVIKDDWFICLDPDDDEDRESAIEMCPYGKAGDRLWVRETFWIQHDSDCDDYRIFDCGINIAEDDWAKVRYCATDKEPAADWQFYSKHPSIHMPRWASRITLEIVSVRVERLQDISERDAIAEGVDREYVSETNDWGVPVEGWGYRDYNDDSGLAYIDSPVESFCSLWDSINAKRGFGWNVNPWVWVIEFKQVTA